MPDEAVSQARAARLYADSLVWDQHGCLALRPDESSIDQLELYREAGVDHISINVGMDITSTGDVFRIVAAFRHGIAMRSDRFCVATTVGDVDRARESGRLAVTFDLEGTEPLDGDIAVLEAFYELGVRTILIAYNRANRAGGGCLDEPAGGLTAKGREIVREMNRLGVIVDATHCSRETTFDLFELSEQPVVFSHSIPLRVKDHHRNISDDQMRACAATGGVVGINGVGIFLGENDASTQAFARAVESAVEIVGPEHVGIGLDYVFDLEELETYLHAHRNTFPAGGGYTEYGRPRFVSPLQLSELTAALVDRGFGEDDVRAILGENFRRVAAAVWHERKLVD
ncbi:MAG: dipeptidase [Gaiellaceae bacterium]